MLCPDTSSQPCESQILGYSGFLRVKGPFPQNIRRNLTEYILPTLNDLPTLIKFRDHHDTSLNEKSLAS